MRPQREQLVAVTAHVPRSLHARLKKIAADEDRTLNDLVTLALRSYVTVKESVRVTKRQK